MNTGEREWLEMAMREGREMAKRAPKPQHGDRIAWTETAEMGRTNDISQVHRFSHVVDMDESQTLCGAWMPTNTMRHLPQILPTLKECKLCNAAMAQEFAA